MLHVNSILFYNFKFELHLKVGTSYLALYTFKFITRNKAFRVPQKCEQAYD